MDEAADRRLLRFANHLGGASFVIPMNAPVSIADRYQAAQDHPERQYLGLLADILETGVRRDDRHHVVGPREEVLADAGRCVLVRTGVGRSRGDIPRWT